MSDRDWIPRALDAALESVAGRLHLEGYPHVTEGGEWVLSDDGFWTGGFWIGLLWAGYEERGDARFRAAAERLLASFAARAGETRNHDLGMMFCPSAVKGYELTGDPRFRATALEAAHSLAAQFNARGRFIPGWGFFGGDAWEGAVLVDTLMNVPLLLWAAREGDGLERLRVIALSHGETSLRHQLRADDSTFHVYRFDPRTGEPVGGDTYQGKSPASCWSRGQAWAIAGCARLARLGAGERYRAAAKRAAAYYLAHLPEDSIPYWDFDAAPGEPRDASAGAIAAFGLLLLDDETATAAAERCLRALAERAQAPPGHAAILLHATADLPHGIGIDESTIYGDYFFVRALQLLRDRIHATARAAVHETGGSRR